MIFSESELNVRRNALWYLKMISIPENFIKQTKTSFWIILEQSRIPSFQKQFPTFVSHL